MDREAIVDRIRALRDPLGKSGVTHVAFFGSRARGDARSDSDLDLFIEVDAKQKFSLLDLIGVEHRIGDELSLTVNATMRRSLPTKFAEAIAAETIEIF